jgi:hypothetical protein
MAQGATVDGLIFLERSRDGWNDSCEAGAGHGRARAM